MFSGVLASISGRVLFDSFQLPELLALVLLACFIVEGELSIASSKVITREF